MDLRGKAIMTSAREGGSASGRYVYRKMLSGVTFRRLRYRVLLTTVAAGCSTRTPTTGRLAHYGSQMSIRSTHSIERDYDVLVNVEGTTYCRY